MMLTVTSAELKTNFEALLEKVERGDELRVVREDGAFGLNRTILGEDVGKGRILGPIEGPIIEESEWRCLNDGCGAE